jgi:hypothetical protein
MLNIVLLFLIFIAIVAVFGRFRSGPRITRRDGGLKKPRICPDCGRYNLQGGPCRDCSSNR